MPSRDPAIRAKHQREYWERWKEKATPEQKEEHRKKQLLWHKKYEKTVKAKDGARRRQKTEKGVAATLRNRYSAVAIFNRLKHHAARRGIEFALTKDDVKELLSPMKCKVTGLPLHFPTATDGKRRYDLLAPSLDRIENSRDYTKDNVHCVALWVNLARNSAPLEALTNILASLRGEVVLS